MASPKKLATESLKAQSKYHNRRSSRRTFTTESVRNRMNLFHVQNILEHKITTVTRIYAEQVNSEDAIGGNKAFMR